MKQLGDRMQHYIGYLVCFFLGMLVSDIFWLRKFGIFSVWRANLKSWRVRKASK